MRRFKGLWFVLLVPAFIGLPASALAQFRTFGGGYFGGPNFGNVGGFGYLGGYGNLGFGGYGNFGYGQNMMPGLGGPTGAVPGISNAYYNPGWNYASPYNSNGFSRSGPILFPGFSASEPLRSRASLYPAISEPTRNVMAAALEAEEQGRARIDIHVPTANAQVYLEGVLTKQPGLDRTYVTPKLNADSSYSFNVVVVWQDEAGRNRTLRRELSIRAGETSSLNLREPD